MVSELTTIGRQLAPPVTTSLPAANAAINKNDVAVSGNDVPPARPAVSAASHEDVLEAVHKMKDYMQRIDRDLNFTIDKDSGMTVVKVIDPSTDEVVRQIPTEEIMRVVRSLESGGGLLSKIKA